MTIEIKVRHEESSKLRRLLSKHRFIIYVVNPLTNDLSFFDEKVLSYNNGFYYSCIYNEENLPSQEIFKAIERNPAVISFVIAKS